MNIRLTRGAGILLGTIVLFQLGMIGLFQISNTFGMYVIAGLSLLVYGLGGFWFLKVVLYDWFPLLWQKLGSQGAALLVSGVTGLFWTFGHIRARIYLNTLTGVDPGNFNTTLIIFTTLYGLYVSVIVLWLLLVCVSLVKLLVPTLLAEPALAPAKESSSVRHFLTYALGPMSLLLLLGWLEVLPIGLIGKRILVAADFSHDSTCAVSSETQWVAPLKDQQGLTVSNVLIADVQSWWDIHFRIGPCNVNPEP